MIDLKRLGACSEAMSWYDSYDWPDDEAAWLACERPDWLLWLAERSPRVTKVMAVRAACAIARSVLYLVKEGEDRPRLAIEAAERWCDDPSEGNRNAAYAAANAAANAAAYAAYDAAAYDAAYAAANAAAAYVVGNAAAYAAANAAANAAADAAADAAAYAAYDAAAYADQRALNCAIVRDCIPFSAIIGGAT